MRRVVPMTLASGAPTKRKSTFTAGVGLALDVQVDSARHDKERTDQRDEGEIFAGRLEEPIAPGRDLPEIDARDQPRETDGDQPVTGAPTMPALHPVTTA
jgi:hypothetical protein